VEEQYQRMVLDKLAEMTHRYWGARSHLDVCGVIVFRDLRHPDCSLPSQPVLYRGARVISASRSSTILWYYAEWCSICLPT